MMDIAQHKKPTPNRLPYLGMFIFSIAILYYCFAYLLRVYPSVMVGPLLKQFHISAGQFGNLTAFYYYAYAPLQIPVGMAVDRIGARRSLILASFISLVGITLFTFSPSFSLAALGRFLVGAGAAFAYVTALKIAILWLPKRYFATATGVVTGSGMLAAVFTDLYLTHIVQHTSYQHALYFCIAIGVVIFLMIIMFVRDKKNANPQPQSEQFAISWKQLGSHLIAIFKKPQMWIIGVIGTMLYLPASMFLDVWGIPYLKTVYHLSPEQAAFAISCTLLGWIICSPITGALSDHFKTRKIPLLISTFGSGTIASLIFFLHMPSVFSLYSALFVLGMLCSAHPLCFTMSKENNPPEISGTSIAFANCLIMLGGVIFQPLVGYLLQAHWLGKVINGVPVYSAENYISALYTLPIALLCSGLLALMIKETYHHKH